MLIITQTALELGFLYALVAMALFLSYRILDIADLTTDGCFVLGAAVSVTVTAAGHPVLAIFAAMLAGACAGFVTAFLQTKLGVPSILAGIVTNTGLYTVNLMAMGWKSNQSLLGGKTVFTMLRETGIGGEWYELLLAAFVTILAGLLLVLFLGTRMGLSIRATGDNPDMVRASSLNPSFTVTVGLCLANMLTALSGAIVGQYQKTVDINSGTRPQATPGGKVAGLSSVSIKAPISGTAVPQSQQPAGSNAAETEKKNDIRPLNSPRSEAYTDDAFREGWREFVRQHEKEAMLYNAMIKGFPSATGEPFHYEFVVDNPAQKDKIESFMPDILQSLRNFVSNDSVMLSVKVRERQPGEKIWNQTELMKEAAERNPKVLEFIKKYQLSLA